MAIEEPDGCWSEGEAKIAVALANSESFRQLIGVESIEDATAKIYGERRGLPINGDAYTEVDLATLGGGYAQVYSAEDEPFGYVRISGVLRPFGNATVFWERRLTEAEQAGAQEGEDIATQQELGVERWFKNRCGKAMREIAEWCERYGPTVRGGMTITRGPGFNPEEDWKSEGMWQGLEFLIPWGNVGG